MSILAPFGYWQVVAPLSVAAIMAVALVIRFWSPWVHPQHGTHYPDAKARDRQPPAVGSMILADEMDYYRRGQIVLPDAGGWISGPCSDVSGGGWPGFPPPPAPPPGSEPSGATGPAADWDDETLTVLRGAPTVLDEAPGPGAGQSPAGYNSHLRGRSEAPKVDSPAPEPSRIADTGDLRTAHLLAQVVAMCRGQDDDTAEYLSRLRSDAAAYRIELARSLA